MSAEYDRDNDTTPLAAASYEYLAHLVDDSKPNSKNLPSHLSELKSGHKSFDYEAVRAKFRKLAKQPIGVRVDSESSENITALISAYRDFLYIFRERERIHIYGKRERTKKER